VPQIGQSLTIMPRSGGGGNPGIHRECTVGFLRARKGHSWILCDNLVSLPKVQMTRFVGTLTRSKREELDRALKMALALE
jgi:mRNA-degrading endonuclease toxin of MazEF toxin-antitoxin module